MMIPVYRPGIMFVAIWDWGLVPGCDSILDEINNHSIHSFKGRCDQILKEIDGEYEDTS